MALCKATLIGNAGTDPEMRYTQAGKEVLNFRLACSRRVPGQEGELRDQTEWFTVICFGKLAEVASRFVSKGRQVYIEGRLQTRSYEGRDGQPRFVVEVVANELQLLGSRERTDGGEYAPPAMSSAVSPMAAGPADNADLDDVPF